MSKRERSLGPHFNSYVSTPRRILENHTFYLKGIEIGKENFTRAWQILESLVEAGEIVKIKRATQKQDRKGTDVFCYVRREDNVVRVPFQVKSSGIAARGFLMRHNEPIGLLVVNPAKTDEDIKINFRVQVKQYFREVDQLAG